MSYTLAELVECRLKPEEKSRMYPCLKARCVMMSGDSPPPLHASTSFSALDGPDDSRGKITPPLDTSLDKPSTDTEMDVSKEEVPIIQTTVPAPEPRPKIEKNGFDRDMIDGKKPVHDVDDDSCLIKCVYFTQQCCECRIL
ncbi:uncharacterized protein LOC105703260 isoform X3 [Orussus abietinus]|uniref:uncharacterized protein LOC105703260 isoform X3 n=1 Tax=Orussus abietinus TaxID=222816 RepID=UPI000625F37D|nr:uncharacterized protein LOC105703260 isoform X3 [Orussus abietinus]